MGLTEIILVFSIGMTGDRPTQQMFEYPQVTMEACQVEKKKFTDARGTSKGDGIYRYTAFCVKRYAAHNSITKR